jgi:hypothetical protein
MIKVTTQLAHGEIRFAADLADGFADASRVLFIVFEIFSQKDADLAKEMLL